MTTRPACITAASAAPRVLSRIGRTGEPLGLLADLAGPAGLRALRVHHEILPPGRRSSSPHAHTTREELVYVLEGRPEVWLDGAYHPLAPGDAVAFAAGSGAAHMLVNRSPHDAALLVVATAAPDDTCVYAQDPGAPSRAG